MLEAGEPLVDHQRLVAVVLISHDAIGGIGASAMSDGN